MPTGVPLGKDLNTAPFVGRFVLLLVGLLTSFGIWHPPFVGHFSISQRSQVRLTPQYPTKELGSFKDGLLKIIRV